MTTPDSKTVLAHDLAMMTSVPVCGLPCRPLSMRSFIMLKQCGNKFVVGGGHPDAGDVAIFLWFHSFAYTIDPKTRTRFMKSIRSLLKPQACVRAIIEINRYLASALLDAPEDKGETTATAVIHLLAGHYGWGSEEILTMPLSRALLFAATIRADTPAVPA